MDEYGIDVTTCTICHQMKMGKEIFKKGAKGCSGVCNIYMKDLTNPKPVLEICSCE